MKRLREVEAELEAERQRAKAWLAAHQADLPPANSGSHVGGRSTKAGKRRQSSYVARLPEWAANAAPRYSEKGRFTPLTGQRRQLDLESIVVSAQVRHVLSKMKRPEQRELIWRYYVLGEPWTALRHKHVVVTDRDSDGNLRRRVKDESNQSFHTRLAWARKAFLRAWAKHANDPIILTEEDF